MKKMRKTRKLFFMFSLFTIFILGFATSSVALPSGRTIILQWDQNDDADSYLIGIVDRTANPGTIWPSEIANDPNLIMLFDIPDGDITQLVLSTVLIDGQPLKYGKTYEFKIKAYNAYGNSSDWSDSAIVSLMSAPQIPSNLRITELITPVTIIININGEKINIEPPATSPTLQ